MRKRNVAKTRSKWHPRRRLSTCPRPCGIASHIAHVGHPIEMMYGALSSLSGKVVRTACGHALHGDHREYCPVIYRSHMPEYGYGASTYLPSCVPHEHANICYNTSMIMLLAATSRLQHHTLILCATAKC
eukprot:SAG11_NODE_19245_length_471_cov_0.690860_1_plen_129_part_10